MQAKKPYISTGLRHIFAIASPQIPTMMETSIYRSIQRHLGAEPTNRR